MAYRLFGVDHRPYIIASGLFIVDYWLLTRYYRMWHIAYRRFVKDYGSCSIALGLNFMAYRLLIMALWVLW